MAFKRKALSTFILGFSLLSSSILPTTFASGDITTYTPAGPDKYDSRVVGSYAEDEEEGTIKPLDTGISYYRDGYVRGTATYEYSKDETRHFLVYKEYITVTDGTELSAKYTSSTKETVQSTHDWAAGVEFPIKLVKVDLGYKFVSSQTHEVVKGQEINATFKKPGSYVIRLWAVAEVYNIYADWRAKVYPGEDTVVKQRRIGRIKVPTPFTHTEVKESK